MRDDAAFCDRCGLSVSHPDQPSDPPAPEPEAASEDPLIGSLIDSKYEVLSRLGEGGMGAVYRARRRLIGDEVAVKVLLPKYVSDAEMLERFRREARAAAMLHHPNVVTIFDYGEARGEESFAYIVMELLDGESLRDVLRRDGRLTPARALRILFETCAGVGAAHRRHVLHRDLKPDNIIILPSREDWERETVKVVDFGIAKLRDLSGESTLTQVGSVLGTPHYMSPEQCRGETLDARADVYSLGVILYEMLAGTPPYVSASPTGVIAKHLTEPPPRLPPYLGVPFELEQTITRALAKDPAARHADAVELAREIQARISMLQSPEQAAAVNHLLPPGGPPPAPPSSNNFTETRREAQPLGGNGRTPVSPLQVTSLDPRATPLTPPYQPVPQKSRAGLYTLLTVLGILVGAGAALAALYFSGVVKFDWGDEEAGGKVTDNGYRTPTPTPTPAPTPYTQTFASTTPIEIPSSGPATPYPSGIEVNNLNGRVKKVTVRLNNVSHTLLSDLDIMLVAPSGDNLVLLSEAAGGYKFTDTTIIFDDAAPPITPTASMNRNVSFTQGASIENMPRNTSSPGNMPANSNTATGSGRMIIPSGGYRPTGSKGRDSAIPSPAPPPSSANSLSVFQRGNPNGTWRLYVYDDLGGDLGRVAGGWSITITVDPSPQPVAATVEAERTDGRPAASTTPRRRADAALPARRRYI